MPYYECLDRNLLAFLPLNTSLDSVPKAAHSPLSYLAIPVITNSSFCCIQVVVKSICDVCPLRLPIVSDPSIPNHQLPRYKPDSRLLIGIIAISCKISKQILLMTQPQGSISSEDGPLFSTRTTYVVHFVHDTTRKSDLAGICFLLFVLDLLPIFIYLFALMAVTTNTSGLESVRKSVNDIGPRITRIEACGTLSTQFVGFGSS